MLDCHAALLLAPLARGCTPSLALLPLPPWPTGVLTVAPGPSHRTLTPADVPNLASLRNPAGVAAAALPLTLRMLSHVPILVSSRRSQTSGSPTHVTAKLWLQPLPAEAAAAAGSGAAGGSDAPGAAAVDAASLREARAPGIQENWD